MTPRDIVVLGSTGSIGTQALDLVRANPDRFRVVGLTAGGSNPDLFEQQVAEFAPGLLRAWGRTPRSRRPAGPCDVVLNGITGAVGPAPDAGRAGRRHHARAGQQGVADHRRPAGPRARRRRARSCRSTPSTPRWRSACAAARRRRRYAGWC